MTSANRPPSANTPRQPWTPEPGTGGVTCPACGLANEPGARTCRNCGLPIARAHDPVRGVAPGRVDLPEARRSGLSATIGFVLVLGLLLVGGTLAVSGGGGLLSGGGRFAAASPTPVPTTDSGSGQVPDAGASPGVDEFTQPVTASGLKFDFTCDDGAITDLGRGKWIVSDVQAGTRQADDGTYYDQVYWKMTRASQGRTKNPTTATMHWTTPQAIQDRFGIGRVQGDRAILVTFDGPVKIAANSSINTDSLSGAGIDQIKRVQTFTQAGTMYTAIGIKSESCARMRSTGWAKKANRDDARVVLDIERFDTPS
jgi:hypothetical protein